MENRTYTILEEKREAVEKKLRRYEKKAQKYGIPFHVRFGELYCVTKNQRTEDGEIVERKYEVCDLTIESEVIQKDGYQIIAHLEHSPNGNIVNVFEGTTKKEWTTMHAHCDHCNGNHGQKYTFIVRKGDEEKQVGRTCLKDYCGIDPQMVGMHNEFADEVDEFTIDGYDFREPIPCVYDAVYMLAHAIAVYREQGYIKSDEYKSNKGELIRRAMDTPSAEDLEKATIMADHITEMSLDDAINARLNNVQVRLNGFYCKPSDFGYFAYAPVAYENWERKQAEQKRREAERDAMASVSEHVGTIGERRVFNVKDMTLLTSFPTDYGYTFLYRFIDENDNVLIWFASNPFGEDNRTTRVSKIKATVKAHTERDGVKQTVINRVKEEN